MPGGKPSRRLRHLNAAVWGPETMSAEIADKNVELIKKLIETCRDGQAGYLEAAEHARNADLRAFFSQQAMERARFAAELGSAARRLGEADPSQGPSIASKMHRAWIDLKYKLGGRDAGVLSSVESGEHIAKEHYLEALRAGLPPEVQTILERQAESVFAAYDQVCSLHSVYTKAA
jgi:uncharacterized protein (TIGR02284 family)